MDTNLVNIIDTIKSILFYIIPVASALIGMRVQYSIDNSRERSNYIRKRKEIEIDELKKYYMDYSHYSNALSHKMHIYEFVINKSITHNQFIDRITNSKGIDIDLDHISLMQKIYFQTSNLAQTQKILSNLLEIWSSDKSIKDINEYKSNCTSLIKLLLAHEEEIVKTIISKNAELLSS